MRNVLHFTTPKAHHALVDTFVLAQGGLRVTPDKITSRHVVTSECGRRGQLTEIWEEQQCEEG